MSKVIHQSIATADMILLYFILLLNFGASAEKDDCKSVKKGKTSLATKFKSSITQQMSTQTDVCTCSQKQGKGKEKIHDEIKGNFDGSTKTCDYDNFTMTVVKMNMMNNVMDNRRVKIPAQKLSKYDSDIEVFVPMEPFLNVSDVQARVSVVRYKSPQEFINNSNITLKSPVIAVEVVDREIKDLSNLLVINFTVNSSEITENQTLSCQFFNETELWNDTGSFTNLDHFKSNNIVTCSYNHMTPFAVLLVSTDQTPMNLQQWNTLSYISYIGCSLSAFFTAVTMFLYTFKKSSNRDTSIRIHVSLSAAVFLLNTSFLFIEWAATWSHNACVPIAVIIQYSLLSCFSWMAIEALHLYLLLIKVFNTYIKHYMIKLSLFGWGVPAVLVGGSLCVYKDFYGTKTVTFSNTNEKKQFCWIIDDRLFYGMTITYFSITFLFNMSILVVVTHQIWKLKGVKVRGSNIPSCKDICTVLGLAFLLGMTWSLAFFTSGYTNYPILYLFCICNTLQGLFLFLWVYFTMKRNRCLETQASAVSERTLAS